MSKNKAIALHRDQEQLPALYHEKSELIRPLTQDIVDGISEAIRDGLRPERACAILKIGESVFREWYNAGKALYGQYSDSSIPNFPPKQIDESDEEYEQRYAIWIEQCDLRVNLYLECNAKLSELSKEMMVVWREHAHADAPDSWKAAKSLEERIEGNRSRTGVIHEHIHSGEVRTKHSQQVSMILGNIASATVQNENEQDIIDAEIIENQDEGSGS